VDLDVMTPTGPIHSRRARGTPVKGVQRRLAVGALAVAGLLLTGARDASAQSGDPLRMTAPPETVTAQKEDADPQGLPVSVTGISKELLGIEGITSIGDAAIFAPNTFFSEFQARKLSFPVFRGITSGPGNPAITTYVDGVPMIHTNASSIELIDVEQIELVRGGQSALFGRNALGGIVNVASSRPSLTKWIGALSVPLGNYAAREARGVVSGPLSGRSAISVAAGRSARHGFTTNALSGDDIDRRGNTFAKAQLLWTPATNWETRLIVGGERARDGDYALADLGSLRTSPFRTARDFEGHTDRDVVSGTLLTRHAGGRMTWSTATGVVHWTTTDETDLDYSPFPAATRLNDERATQFTEEIRFASATAAPSSFGNGTTLRWQGGIFLFTQGYDQNAVNSYSPFVVSQQIPFAVQQTSPLATLDDLGVGVYGQATVTRNRLDVALGARVDHESKDASLDSFYAPVIAAPTHVSGDRSFSNVSPQVSVAYRLHPNRMAYVSVTSGYKSGGFNPAAPGGAESFGEEHTWQTEGGVKTMWASGRVRANAAFFVINWDDMQLNVPIPQVPTQFFVANVGGARSAGVEVELNGRATRNLELFGVVGYTHGRFSDGSVSSGVDISGNDLPNTPDYTTTFGAEYRQQVAGNASLFGRGEVAIIGAFQYDPQNGAGQDAYALTNLRAGVQKGQIVVDGWIKNAFDQRYVPLAFPYPGQPSGYVGENGRPRTIGVTVGLRF
jgi:iron complex outermembrane recepter protein